MTHLLSIGPKVTAPRLPHAGAPASSSASYGGVMAGMMDEQQAVPAEG